MIGMGYTDKDATRLYHKRNNIYAALYRSGLHETADMFWTAWRICYKQSRNAGYRIVRL
ncbi:hypothetical protein LCGC14_1582200 [marine sediment metagenome]|uniref:Uncharacterized protein n=1 Tax=marine sediment metagenome TaxID=412755 RepID=A0A0F9IGI2_9ZZZZ